MTAAWQGGKTYVPGSLVVPTAGATPVQVQPANAGFETGDKTGWTTADAGRWTVGTNKYEGTYGCRVTGDGLTSMQSNTLASVKVGQQVSVSVKCSITNDGTDDAHFQVVLQWLDSGGSLIGFTAGNEIQGKGGFWTTSTASGVAPAGTAKFNISLSCNPGSHGSVVDLDSAAYIYAYAPPTAGIIYKATQAAPGKSAATEPAWPGVVGVPITDNQVTWEGELATRIVWEASPLSESGDTEPDWPLATGANVHDGSINYTAQTLQITDPNCPQSKYVVIAASKVYAADTDIIRYCATVNPLDWSTANDAGYLPYGLQDYGSNPCVALGLYRSNVVAFNAEGFQMWQVDPDPANIALLDALPVATEYHHALAPTSNDLFFLASQGVRSMGISSAGVNLEAGDIGMPIDDLVQEALEIATDIGIDPLGTFIPGMGQYWLAFSNFPPAFAIHGDLPDGTVGDAINFQYTASYPTGDVTYSILSGALPTGTSMDASGHVTGNFTVIGTFSWVVRGVDGEGTISDLPDGAVVAAETFDAYMASLAPILWLPLNEPSGSVASDISGFNHPGAYTNCTKGQTGLRPGSLSTLFNAVGDYVEVPDFTAMSTVFNDNPVFSAHVFMKRTGTLTSNEYGRMFGKFVNPNTGNTTFALDINTLGYGTGYYDSGIGGTPQLVTDPVLIDGDQHQFWVTCDGATITLYKDGMPVAATATGGIHSQNAPTFPVSVGGSSSFPGSYQFQGYLSDSIFFDRCVPADQVLRSAQLSGYA